MRNQYLVCRNYKYNEIMILLIAIIFPLLHFHLQQMLLKSLVLILIFFLIIFLVIKAR